LEETNGNLREEKGTEGIKKGILGVV